MVLYRWISAPCPERPGYEASEYMKVLNGEEVVGRSTSSRSKVCFFKAESLCISDEDLAVIAEEYGLPPTTQSLAENKELFLKAAQTVSHDAIDEVIEGIAEKHALLRFDVPDEVFKKMKNEGKIQEACTQYSGDPLGANLMFVMDEVQMDSYDKELQQYMSIVGESKIPGREYKDLLRLSDSSNIVTFDRDNKILFLTTDDSSQSKVYDFGQPDFPRLTVAPGEYFHHGVVFYDGKYNGTRGPHSPDNEYIKYFNDMKAQPFVHKVNNAQTRFEKMIAENALFDFRKTLSPTYYWAEEENSHANGISRIRDFINSKTRSLLYKMDEAMMQGLGENKARKAIWGLYSNFIHEEVPEKVSQYYELRKKQFFSHISYPDIEISRAMIFVDGMAYIKTPDFLSIWKTEQGDFLNSEELIKRLDEAKEILFLPQISDDPQIIGKKELEDIKNSSKIINNDLNIYLIDNILDRAYKIYRHGKLEELAGSGEVRFDLRLRELNDYNFVPEIVWKADKFLIRNITITFNDDKTKACIEKNSPSLCEKFEILMEDLPATCEAINKFIEGIKAVDEKDEDKKMDIQMDMFDNCTIEDIFVFAAAKNIQPTMEEKITREMD